MNEGLELRLGAVEPIPSGKNYLRKPEPRKKLFAGAGTSFRILLELESVSDFGSSIRSGPSTSPSPFPVPLFPLHIFTIPIYLKNN